MLTTKLAIDCNGALVVYTYQGSIPHPFSEIDFLAIY